LQWEHRLPLILQEVREANADIICLQELNHFGKQEAAQQQLLRIAQCSDHVKGHPL
jgi:mRNA deadenylase 3'-5' endonuclease subunit Ccr4